MKKRSYSLLPFILLVLIFSACASTATRPSGDGGEKKKPTAASEEPAAEDLSKYRPRFALADPGAAGGAKNLASGIIPTNHVNEKVSALLDTLARHNKSVRYAKGYRILAYSGTERRAWLDMREAIVRRLPEERDYPQYTQPNYRLKIGDYFTRVEAQQMLLRIRDLSPNAMIVSDQINIK
ncbi:MAG: sporulation protein [Adhaeribacter sp.]